MRAMAPAFFALWRKEEAINTNPHRTFDVTGCHSRDRMTVWEKKDVFRDPGGKKSLILGSTVSKPTDPLEIVQPHYFKSTKTIIIQRKDD